MPDIIISTSSFDLDNNPGIEQLRTAGLSIATNPFGRKLTECEIGELLGDSVVGLLAGVEPLTAKVIGEAGSLRVISRLGVGMDSVDQVAAEARNITVLSTPDAPVDAVVEMTLGLMLATLRQIPAADRQVREGSWPRLKGRLLKSQTVGILGLGRIGTRVAALCAAFGARIIAHDPVAGTASADIERVSLAALFSAADILSLHLPHTAATHHIINTKTLAKMKSGAIVINTARGSLVDEAALLSALQEGRLASAGLDVFEEEPYRGELRQLSQLVLTPHLASSAKESRQKMEYEAAENLYNGLCAAGIIVNGEKA